MFQNRFQVNVWFKITSKMFQIPFDTFFELNDSAF